MGSEGESSTFHCQWLSLSHSCIPGPTTPEPNLVESSCFVFEGKPYKNFTNRKQLRVPKAQSISLSQPLGLSAAFPSVLVGFIAFHLLSHLLSEHFCPRLFVLGLFQDSQSLILAQAAPSTLCSPTDQTHPAGWSVMLPLPAQTVPSPLHSHAQAAEFASGTVPPSKARPPDHNHGMHTEGLWSKSVSLGTSPGIASLGSHFPSLGAVGPGTWGDVAGDRRPTRAAHTQRARPCAAHSQSYSSTWSFQHLSPIAGMGTQQRRGSEPPEQPNSSCLMAAPAPQREKRSQLLPGGMLE